MLRKPIARNFVLVLNLLLYCHMYSVICICHNPVCYICEYSSEATVFQVETFQKQINRFRKDNSSSKTIVGNLNYYLH